MKLHMLPPSPNSQSCIAVVKALKMDIELENAYGKTRTPEYLAMNPCHCAPMVELDDGSAIWESGAILRYLCSIAPDGDKFYPKEDLVKRARIDLALDWRQTCLYPCFPAIGYGIFGSPDDPEEARRQFKKLVDVHFKTLTEVFLKDTKFIYSDTPTIADLAVACPLNFIKVRSKFWDAVPQKVKDYQKAVFEAFPDSAEYFSITEGMANDYSGDGADLSPEE